MLHRGRETRTDYQDRFSARRLRTRRRPDIEALESRIVLSGDVFLQGNYIEVGINPAGSFGSQAPAPAGYHPRPSYGQTSGQLGFVADYGKDGWDVGSPPQTGDYFVPGSPEEGWMVQWTGSSGTVRRGNFGLMGQVDIPQTSLTDTSSGTTRSAVWVGTATNPVNPNEQVRITQTVHFDTNDLFFVINVVMTNVGTAPISGLEYMRNVDPDQEQPVGGSFGTSNYVEDQPAHAGINAAFPTTNTNQALVVAKGLNYGLTLGLGTIDSRATVSTEGFANRNPDDIINSPVMPPPTAPLNADQAIALAYGLGSLAPGQSTSVDYAYILNEGDLTKALGDLAAVTILQPTGTVSGHDVLFQATTNSVPNTTKMDFFVNGTLVGTDTTVDAGGVFAAGFDSTAFPNGTLNLDARATFADGSSVDKTTTVTVDNAGPPIAISTPTAGSSFSGVDIPIAVDTLDSSHLPVRVDFFRETASTGSVFLGEDTTAPFASQFSVNDLLEGETVVIKAVATDLLGRSTTVAISGTSLARATPTFDSLSAPTVDYGTPWTTVTGHIASATGVPSGSVDVTLNGMTTAAPIDAAGNFTTTVSTAGLDVAGSPYSLAFDYKGDTHSTSAAAASTITVLKAMPTITASGAGTYTYNGTARAVTGAVAGVGDTDLGAATLTYTDAAAVTSTAAPVNAGTYTVTLSYPGSDNYLPAQVTATLVINKATASLSHLSSPTIVIGTASTSLSGQVVSSSSVLPVGELVSVTIDGVTKTAPIAADGSFSTSFPTGALSAGPHTISYSYAGSQNFTGTTGAGTLTVAYDFASLDDKAKAVQSGATIPVKIQLKDANGVNISSASLQVTAIDVVDDNGNVYQVLNAGNSDPDNIFRYNADLGGYIFNLKTMGLSAGHYHLRFRVDGDTTLQDFGFWVK